MLDSCAVLARGTIYERRDEGKRRVVDDIKEDRNREHFAVLEIVGKR